MSEVLLLSSGREAFPNATLCPKAVWEPSGPQRWKLWDRVATILITMSVHRPTRTHFVTVLEPFWHSSATISEPRSCRKSALTSSRDPDWRKLLIYMYIYIYPIKASIGRRLVAMAGMVFKSSKTNIKETMAMATREFGPVETAVPFLFGHAVVPLASHNIRPLQAM